MNPQILFDFDGVLIDSHKEPLVTAYNAVTNSSLTSLEALPTDYKATMLLNIHHARGERTFLALAKYALENVAKQALTKNQIAELVGPDTPRETIDSPFFNARNQFIKKDKQAWLALHTSHQPLWSSLQTIDSEQIIILTNKNRSAVIDLCEHFGLEVKKENIYGCDDKNTKVSNFKKIDAAKKAESYLFIDDGISNLMKLDSEFSKTHQIEFALALWGENNEEDLEIAKGRDYRLLTQVVLVDELQQQSKLTLSQL